MSDLANRIKQLRLDNSLSQKELASRVCASQQQIDMVESGGILRPRYIENLARALGVDPGYLLLGKQHDGDIPVDEGILLMKYRKLSKAKKNAVERIFDLFILDSHTK